MLDQLREYQKRDVAFITKHPRMINGSEPGTGKTLVALTAAEVLSPSSILIICPKISFGVWEGEATKWYGWSSLVYTGTIAQRKKLWARYQKEQPKILITNYNMIKELLTICPRWDMIIADEVHLGGLLNHTNTTFENFAKLSSRYLQLLTGTPVRKGPHNMWSLLHLCDRKRFSSYWGFVNKYCIVTTDYFGKTIENRPANVPEFKRMLEPYFIRHTKKEVLPELPDKIRQAIPLTLDGEQKKIYTELLNNMIAETASGDLIVTPNILTQTLRLRQLLISPQLLGAKEPGVVLDALCELVTEEFYSGRAVTICTPFKQAVPYIRAALSKAFAKEFKDQHIPILEIHGDVKERAASVAETFQMIPSHKKVLLYTIKSGASFTAHSASTCFFVGYEWSAIDNLQAEDRIHRLGQKDAVCIYYLVVKGTIDELVMSKLDDRQMAANWVLSPDKMLAAVKGGKYYE